MWASNVLTVEVVYKILYEPFQLSLCYQVHIFHSHIIMWVLSFCQIDIFTITLNIFPFILFSSNLCQSPSRQTVSNSFAKSTNTRYNFFFLFFKILKREWRINKLPKVEYLFRNPIWFSHSTRNSSEYCVSLSPKIEVNNLPKQLKTVIDVQFWASVLHPLFFVYGFYISI